MDMEKLVIYCKGEDNNKFDRDKFISELPEKMTAYGAKEVELVIDNNAVAAIETVKYCIENNIDIKLCHYNHEYECNELVPFTIDINKCNSNK